jgi:hypothetical protein
MPNVIENARKRLADLRRQVSEIERFLQMYEVFEAGGSTDQSGAPLAAMNGELAGNISPENSLKTVDKSGEKRRRSGTRPAEIVRLLERAIREAGRPLTRGEIVEALERRGVEMPATDKPRYIGTIAWRNKGTFRNIEGLGYWLTEEQLPMVMGLPLDD